MMVLSDFSRTLFYPKDPNYTGGLNALHKKLHAEYGGEYEILNYFEFNTELLNFYRSLKGIYPVSIFTTDIIQNHPHVRPVLEETFDHIFSANELGVDKKTANAYILVSEKIGAAPPDIVYIDDQDDNLSAATDAGMKAIHFDGDNKKLIGQIRALLSR
ncbi:MAG: HAD hydrolase-like protein [Candidatus Kaiserbacteria bacterium]|nr:HAD hydrolase-like protein [Candidatus Kaiserbacteria bacterium]